MDKQNNKEISVKFKTDFLSVDGCSSRFIDLPKDFNYNLTYPDSSFRSIIDDLEEGEYEVEVKFTKISDVKKKIEVDLKDFIDGEFRYDKTVNQLYLINEDHRMLFSRMFKYDRIKEVMLNKGIENLSDDQLFNIQSDLLKQFEELLNKNKVK